mmetsp:Transcript_2118/g.8253  ORF Transcript_2118/g.8253 Transcript_2118/m.8253 type:complete len:282 (+) Transcript_2118:1142-1987(+)
MVPLPEAREHNLRLHAHRHQPLHAAQRPPAPRPRRRRRARRLVPYQEVLGGHVVTLPLQRELHDRAEVPVLLRARCRERAAVVPLRDDAGHQALLLAVRPFLNRQGDCSMCVCMDALPGAGLNIAPPRRERFDKERDILSQQPLFCGNVRCGFCSFPALNASALRLHVLEEVSPFKQDDAEQAICVALLPLPDSELQSRMDEGLLMLRLRGAILPTQEATINQGPLVPLFPFSQSQLDDRSDMGMCCMGGRKRVHVPPLTKGCNQQAQLAGLLVFLHHHQD